MPFEVRHLAGDVVGLSPFARAVLAERPWPRVLGGEQGLAVPARLAEWEPPARAEDPTLIERGELVERLRARVDPHGPDASRLHPAVDASIDKLGHPRGLAVVAEAVPAFLGGPLATLLAALHAAALARALERHLARPVAPVLWLRSDEHEQGEARGAWVLNRHLDLTRVALSSMGSGRRPLGSVVLDDDAHRLPAVVAQLRQLLPETEHRDRALALFAPRAGETLGDAQRRAFGALLGHLGLVTAEPEDLRPTLSRALARIVAAGDGRLVDAARARLVAAGCDAPRAQALFRIDEGQRRELRTVGAQFLFEGEEAERSGRELAAEVVEEPERFAPGPLLEPLARDLVLPVAATVGDAELGERLALTLGWRAAVDGPRPAFVPRQRATLLSPMAREALRKRGVELEEVLRARGVFAAPVDGDGQRPAVLDRLRELVRRQTEELKALRGELGEVEKGLAHHLRRAAEENADRVEKIRTRAERVVANRSGKARRHERRLANTLFPRDEPQECLLTTAQYAAAFGTEWIDALASAVDPLPSEHLVLELQQPAAEGGPPARGRGGPERPRT